jgi:molybdopterin synthase catalytic subunit
MIVTLTERPFEPGSLVTAFCAGRAETGAEIGRAHV